VVGGIEARAFEDDPHRLVHFPKGLLGAFRAAGQGWFAEGLLAFELNPAIFAPVRINWHTTPCTNTSPFQGH
jgi:hypothetical protein